MFLCQSDSIFIVDRPINYLLDIKARETILSSGLVEKFSSINFKAEQSIILLENFEVKKNATFNAAIELCN